MARVAALFRRLDVMKNPNSDDNRLSRGNLELDIDRMTVRWKDQPVGLTLTEFWMVHALARYPGHVKNRQQLMDAAQVVLDDNTITSHVKRIRKKFVAIDPNFESIETVYGMGYRYRLHRQDLPGRPDSVFQGRRKVIFVHGCFWHQHRGCKRANIPKSDQEYWITKLDRNANYKYHNYHLDHTYSVA